ncbi:MAG: glycosyltransferase family 4 protein [Bacteroidetes bacterium]|nr:glycosyltransferase family 4 protein [Bacteroidota bacterium]
MKILLLCDEYPPSVHGGIGSITKILAKEYVRMGHQVIICGFYPYFRQGADFEIQDGVNVYRAFYGSKIRLKVSKHWFLGKIINIKRPFKKYTQFLKQIIDKNQIDIIEIPDYNEAFVFSGSKFLSFPDFGIPRVVKLHGSSTCLSHINKSYSYNLKIFEKEKALLSSANHIVGVSEYIRKLSFELFQLENNNSVIYNGVTINREQQYEPDNNINVIYAGKITEKKGVHSLLKAWNSVISEYPLAKLFLYGTSTPKTLKSSLALIEEKYKYSVKFMGFTNNEYLSSVYRKATCAIFPSYAESFGMTPLESMKEACPTIFTRRTSGSEIITDFYDGILIDPDNIGEISDAILFMLKNRKEATQMGIKGAEKIRKYFTSGRIAEQQINLFNKLISNV